MNKKNLPIKIFEKRKEDEMLTEAGGGNGPNWILQGDKLYERAKGFQELMTDVESELEKRVEHESFIPVVLSATISEKAIAKTHRKEINKLFNVNRKSNTIGLCDDNTLIIKVENPNDVKKITRNFVNTQTNAHGISAIEDLDFFTAIVELDIKKHAKIKLFDFQDYELNRITRHAFEQLCIRNELEIKKSFYTNDLLVYRVDNPSSSAIEKLLSFEGLFSIVDMPTYNVSFDMLEGPDKKINYKKPNESQSYPTIGVLDSGISKIGPLKDWIVDDSHTNYIESDIDRSHGTFVAGIIVHGDDLDGVEYTGTEGCMLFDATIAPKKDVMKSMIEDELIDNIREVVDSIDDINIWTLSAGSEKEADIDIYSDFGVALDKLQEDNNIILCKSAGNCTNFLKNAPKSRISRSADSVRSVVVGSAAHMKSEYDIAEIDDPSPFTRIGFAPGGIVKPDLVHYGGNSGLKNGEISITGVNSFSNEGGIVQNVGTSFSTPRVASLFAGLYHKIDEKFDPLLLKALVLHSAKYPFTCSLSDEDRLKQYGFGIPSTVDGMIYNSSSEITLILQDTLEKGKYIDIMDFPFPNLIMDNQYYGEVTVTLVTSPLLDHTQGSEYCQSNIDVFFGTYDEKVVLEGKTIRNPLRRDNSSINLLNKSLYSLKAMKENPNFQSERMLRNYHQKFQPNKKWSINLGELKATPRDMYLGSNRKWYLKLEGLFRANIEETQSDLAQDFCLIITIKDPKGKIPVYDQVSQGLEEYQFIQKYIQLREEIRIRPRS